MEICEITAWPELLKRIFNCSISDYDELWCEIEAGKTRIFQAIGKKSEGFFALSSDPAAIHITACEGYRTLVPSVFLFIAGYAANRGRYFVTANVATGGRVESLLSRIGFTIRWRDHEQTYMILGVQKWVANRQVKQIPLPAQITPPPLLRISD